MAILGKLGDLMGHFILHYIQYILYWCQIYWKASVLRNQMKEIFVYAGDEDGSGVEVGDGVGGEGVLLYTRIYLFFYN